MLLNHKPDESDEQIFYVFSQYPKWVIILVNWYTKSSLLLEKLTVAWIPGQERQGGIFLWKQPASIISIK